MGTTTHALKTVSDLVAAGLATEAQGAALQPVGERYAVAVTPEIAALIDTTAPDDPIARQFVPDVRELVHHPDERADPIGDHAHSPVAGLVHRYPDRVLLKVVSVCPVYCRFCFRREMVGPKADANLSQAELDAAFAYIEAHPEIWEVIVTGGDPFVLSPRRIADVMERAQRIPHLKIIRWHTRVPVVSPGLVSQSLIDALKNTTKTVIVGLHANHPRELTETARRALADIADAGIPILSQTVLLKGVNDTVETLEALMRAFVEARVKPYYLHHADLAPGTAHFRTSIADGQALMRTLRQRLSGIAMPTYMLDVPGGYGKVPVGPDYLLPQGVVLDPNGQAHGYSQSDALCSGT